MLKLSDPPLLVRIYFTTPPHKNIYMIHGMRGYQKVAKSCNKIYIPEKFICKYIYIYITLQDGPESVKEILWSEGPWLGEELEKA